MSISNDIGLKEYWPSAGASSFTVRLCLMRKSMTGIRTHDLRFESRMISVIRGKRSLPFLFVINYLITAISTDVK